MLITMGFGNFYPSNNSNNFYFNIISKKKVFGTRAVRIQMNIKETSKLYFTIKET